MQVPNLLRQRLDPFLFLFLSCQSSRLLLYLYSYLFILIDLIEVFNRFARLHTFAGILIWTLVYSAIFALLNTFAYLFDFWFILLYWNLLLVLRTLVLRFQGLFDAEIFGVIIIVILLLILLVPVIKVYAIFKILKTTRLLVHIIERLVRSIVLRFLIRRLQMTSVKFVQIWRRVIFFRLFFNCVICKNCILKLVYVSGSRDRSN